MKRILLLALFATSSTFGLVGCAEKTSDTVQEVKKTPDGESKTKTTTETTKTGSEKEGH